MKVLKTFGENPMKLAVLDTHVEFDSQGEADVEQEVADVLAKIPGYVFPDADQTQQGEPDADQTQQGEPDADQTQQGEPDADHTQQGEPDADQTQQGDPDADHTQQGEPEPLAATPKRAAPRRQQGKK